MERQEDKAKDTARERSLLDAARPRQKKRKGDPKAKRQVDEDNASNLTPHGIYCRSLGPTDNGIDFELFDEVLDWTYGKTPPPNVCLSDYHVGEAVIYASRETRRRFWPKDFDIAGLIRKARVNVGTAAKFLESANDTWYYRIWLGYYVLQGSEGKEKTVLGDPDKVRKRSGIYFDKGPKAKIQEPPFPQLKVQSISQTQIIDDVANGISSRDVRKKTSATRPEVSHSRRTGWNDSDKWDGIPARSTISRTPSNPWGLRNIKPKPRDPESKAIIARLIQEVRQIDVVTQNRLETEGQAIDVLGENLTTLRKNLSVVYNQLTDGLTIMTRQVEGLSEFIEMTKRSATLNKTADNALESLAGIEGFFSLKDTMLDFTPIVQPVQIPGFDFEPPNDNADADKEEEGNEHSGSEATIPED